VKNLVAFTVGIIRIDDVWNRIVEGNVWTIPIYLIQNTYRNRLTAKHIHIQEDDNEVDFKEIGCLCAD
jgi:hypothetical protein